MDYARYANLVEKFNGPIDWSAYKVTEKDCSDIEPGDAASQAEAKKQFIAEKTWVDPVPPTPRTVGKKLGGVRLSKQDMDLLRDMGISS